jgi:hypothetical protein
MAKGHISRRSVLGGAEEGGGFGRERGRGEERAWVCEGFHSGMEGRRRRGAGLMILQTDERGKRRRGQEELHRCRRSNRTLHR